MPLRPGEILIDDDTPHDVLFRPHVNGELKGRGAIPRDYTVQPVERFAPPSEIDLIPQSEWSARVKEIEATASGLSHIRGSIPSLDQGQNGYCWGHSTTHAVMLLRALMNLPYVPLSAYAVCATIKRGANEGGWCGLSADFHEKRGAPSQALWPQGDRNYRQYDRPEVWENAGLHKVTEDWIDLTRDVYDRNLTFAQVMTCALLRIPVAFDFNWWGHSIAMLDAVEVEPGSFGFRIWNSWSDGWGERGTGVLRGQKAVPDGAVALRVTGASAV
jgi:hypothetical protein